MQGKKMMVAGMGALALAAGGWITFAAASAGASSTNKNLVLIQGTKADDFYITMGCAATKEAKKLGYKISIQGPASFSAPLQIPILDAAIATKPGAVAIAATDVQALIAPEKTAVAKGIHVVQVDTAVTGGTKFAVSTISSNNMKGGELAADALANDLGGKGSVVVMNEQPGVSTTDARIAGFVFEMALKYDKIRVLPTQYVGDSPTTAATTMDSLLVANPDLAGVFATNVLVAEGTDTGIKNAGKSGQVKIVGYDADPAQITALKTNVVQALIAQEPAVEGKDAVDQMVASLTGKPVKKAIQTALIVITQANLAANTKYVYAGSCS